MTQENKAKSLHLAMNLTPLVGAIAFGWTPFSIVYSYWLESLGIVGFTSIKMIMSKGDENMRFKFAKSVWHFIKYSFVLGFYMLFMVAFLGLFLEDMSGKDPDFLDYLIFLEPSFRYAMLGLLATKTIYFYGDYVQNKKYETATHEELKKGTSSRMVTIHLVILLGFFSAAAVMELGNKDWAFPVFAMVFVSIKAIIDYFTVKWFHAV